MSERKNKSHSRLFLQWSFSYLVISAIALVLMLASGYRYTDVLRDNLEYTNGIELDMTRVWLDQKLEVLRSITSRESFNSSIREIQNESDYDQLSRYDLFRLTKEISTDVVDFGIDDTYFLYFPQTDVMVSNAHYGNSHSFYLTRLEGFGISYEDWETMVSGNYSATQVFEPVVKGSKDYLVLIRPLNVNNIRTVKVNAVMIVNLADLSQSSQWLEDSVLCIVDNNADKLVTDVDNEIPEDIASQLQNRMGYEKGTKITAAVHAVVKGSYISMISSRYENWEIAIIISERTFTAPIRGVQRLLLVVLIAYVVLSLVILLDSVNRRYGRFKKVIQVLSQGDLDEPAEDEGSGDAYAYLDNKVQKLVQTNTRNSDMIEQQKNSIRQELFNTLVTSAAAAKEVDENALHQSGFPLSYGQTYDLLAYRLQDNAEGGDDQVQEMEWFILRNVTEENLQNAGLSDLCIRRRNTQVYVIWAEDSEEIPERVAKVYQNCQEFISRHFQLRYTAAVSATHTGKEEIFKAYQEVREVFHYQKKEPDSATVFYGSIPSVPQEAMPRYPAEEENRLVLAVRNGSSQEARERIHGLLMENQEYFLRPAAMQYLVGKIMASILQEAGEIASDPEIIECQNHVMENIWQEDPTVLEQSLCTLSDAVCSKKQEFNEKAQQDEKTLLYYEIKHYIDVNYADAGLNVNSIAEHFGRTPSFVSRYFKEMNGMNLTPYIHEVRLQHAKQLLLQDGKLETIAMSCGFGSQRSFLRIFKQYEGVTPSQYRELHSSRERT